MDIEVVCPWRPGCAHRGRAWRWVRSRYEQKHSDWAVSQATSPAGGWCKAAAVNPAIARSSAQIIVQADADVWTEGLGDAVAAVEEGAAWAVPHAKVHRLSEEGSVAVLAGAAWRGQPLAQAPYPGVLGGGIVVARRETLGVVPLDRRFVGWGQDDEAHAIALDALFGAPWRGSADLVHLWHPPQERRNRRKGSPESWALRQRYKNAHHDPEAIRSLLEEGR